MSLLTVDQLKEHIETDRSEDSLQLLIDSAEDDIRAQAGEHDSQIDDLTGGDPFLFLSRPAQSITSIVERIYLVDTTLATNDYELRQGGRSLWRSPFGTHGWGNWGSRVVVTYVPKDDQNRRKRVLVDLVRLSLKFNALKSERVGDFSSTSHDDYETQRQRLLNTLAGKMRVMG